MTILAAISLSVFFSHPMPLDMPRAEAYLVSSGDSRRLEDRFNVQDLWTSRAVLGRWEDDDGRCFTVSRLDKTPPVFAEKTMTRTEYTASEATIDKRKDLEAIFRSVNMLSPVPLAEEPSRPRQMPRGIKDAEYMEGTNTAIVCRFLPEKSDTWYLATWELVEGDETAAMKETFEEGFLTCWDDVLIEGIREEIGRAERLKEEKSAKAKRKKRESPVSERELLRIDARHSVTNYVNWHATDSDEFVVLDDLQIGTAFIQTLTNDLKTMRARYADVVPSPLDGSNVLCVARVFKDRDEYLDTIGDDMKWTAAYWDPTRRELVAYLPENGEKELLKTIRHEAFHQYLSYAASMISASPWFNEGYAQYFEDEESEDWELGPGALIDLEALSEAIPSVMKMGYKEFYDGTDAERRVKYRLAWSMARFIEKGAPEIRFKPFKDLKSDYIESLLKKQDMTVATAEAFGSEEKLKLFVAEWVKFWKKRMAQ